MAGAFVDHRGGRRCLFEYSSRLSGENTHVNRNLSFIEQGLKKSDETGLILPQRLKETAVDFFHDGNRFLSKLAAGCRCGDDFGSRISGMISAFEQTAGKEGSHYLRSCHRVAAR